MHVWVDLANSPQVLLLEPVVSRLRGDGHRVSLTARDHAQTVELARQRWPDVAVIGEASPRPVLGKGRAVARRAYDLGAFARPMRPDVAFSHNSYAQAVAARALRIPLVTMMDYEHQPANHLAFRLARRVIVPEWFPADALRKFGARPHKVVRFPGFKEDLYLGKFDPDPGVLAQLQLDPQQVIAVFRPPPEGALYHRHENQRFEELLALAVDRDNVQPVVLPRTNEQRVRYLHLKGAHVPPRAVDALSLLALADVTIGAGGTMARESAILGTPTYTVFSGGRPAVDRALIDTGRLHDLLDSSSEVVLAKRPEANGSRRQPQSEPILATVIRMLEEVGLASQRPRRRGGGEP